MPKHHSEDYKITAVKHYVNKSKNLSKTCKIFECSRISLKRWVNRYKIDFVKNYKQKTKWIIKVDIDEFIYPINTKLKIKDILHNSSENIIQFLE